METESNKRIGEAEIIFYEDDVILKLNGNHRSVTEELKNASPELVSAIRELAEFGHRPSVDSATPEASEGPEILNFLELINKEFPDVPWDVEGIFESGTINMISAPPNQYKSWIVLHMAMCISQGTKVFRKYDTKAQNVLIINEEDNLRMIKDRSLKMIEDRNDLGIHFQVMSGYKLDANSVEELHHEIIKRDISFVVFDSLRSVHEANENDSQEMQKVMDNFKYLTKRGVTVLFTHHNRKKAFGKSKDEFGEESRGSTAINAAVHGHLSCEEIILDKIKYLLIIQRKLKSDKKLEPFLVKINIDEENKWSFEYMGNYDAKEATFKKNTDDVLATIERSNFWLCKKDIAVAIGAKDSTVAKVLQGLEKDKLILSKTKGELEKESVQIGYPDAKHNAKFYFRKDENELGMLVNDLQTDSDF